MVLDKVQVKPEINGNAEDDIDILQTLELPESLYSAAMVLPLETFDGSKFWNNFIHSQMIFSLFVNYFIQGTLIGYLFYIAMENADEHGYCGGYNLTPMIYRLCVLIYIAYCLKDMIETLEMMYWFRMMANKQSQILDDGKIMGAKQTAMMYKVVDEDDDTTQDVLLNARKINVMSTSYTIYIYAAVLIPKFMIAVAVMLIGTGFIVNTDSDENLILNALALGFILEMDEMIYEFIASPQWQECVCTIPRIQILGDERKAGFWKRFGVPLKIALLAVLSYGSLIYFCPDANE